MDNKTIIYLSYHLLYQSKKLKLKEEINLTQ